jgi:penicillin-binding protein 1A
VADVFRVHNFENSYSGSTTLANATAHSDNSVFATVGMQVGPKRVAREAKAMGIKTKLSTNPAMLLGGLSEGVTPLEMAFAFSTIANFGKRVSGTLASSDMGPVAIEKVADPSGNPIDTDHVKTERVYSHEVGATMRALLHGVVVSGTGKHSQVATWSGGKTGTTEDYGDAWFIGFTDRYTVAVWVGYADHVKSMSTEYSGGPVEGGTFPAEIWHDLVTALLNIDAARHPDRPPPIDTGPVTPSLPSAPPTDQTQTAPPDQGGSQDTPQQPQQQQQTPPPQGGGGGGGGGNGGGQGGDNGNGGGAKPAGVTGQ